MGLWSCGSYDDTKIWDSFHDLEDRVTKLEQLCQKLNGDVEALQTLVEALQKDDYVTGVTTITENGDVIGYTITFAKSEPVNIYNGKNGADGKDGECYKPVIGVKKDVDGIYYWTLDGEWLTDDNGDKVKAEGESGADGEDGTDGNDGVNGEDGADGVTPQFKIEDDYWYISYDNGVSWTLLGKATGEDGKDGSVTIEGESLFKEIITSNEDFVIFILQDGTEIKLPTWYAFEQLKALCNQTNTNLSSLQAIVEALRSNDYITGVTPLLEDGVEVGYTISFANSAPITIFHGKDGESGSAVVPSIGVKKSTDGVYYWTLNGEWLTDSNGNKVKAEGDDGEDGANGITPKLKIEGEYWYVSYDNGGSWTQVGKATSEGGQGSASDSIFTDIDIESDSVTFFLNDGSSFTLPMSYQTNSDIIHFLDNGVKIRCVLNWDTNGDNELSYSEAAAVTSLNGVFSYSESLLAFDELQYFTSLTEIADYEFDECYNLHRITLPKNIKRIGNSAFSGCSSLKEIEIPVGVTVIDEYAFADCVDLTSIVIPEGVTTIGESAFSYCVRLRSAHIAQSVESFGIDLNGYSEDGERQPFSNCYALEIFSGKFASDDGRSLIVDDALVSFAPANISSYTIPEGVKIIGSRSFPIPYTYDAPDDAPDYEVKLQSVTIPASVERIDSEAIYHNGMVKEYHFLGMTPPSVANFSLGSPYLYDDEIAPVIYVPDGAYRTYVANTTWKESEYYKWIYVEVAEFSADSIIKYTTSDNEPAELYSNLDYATHQFIDGVGYICFFEPVKSVNQLFDSAENVTSVTLPAGVESIDAYFFYRLPNVTEFVVPESVTYIALYETLKVVHFTSLVPPELEYYYINSDLVIYVPDEALDAYLTCDWNINVIRHIYGFEYRLTMNVGSYEDIYGYTNSSYPPYSTAVMDIAINDRYVFESADFLYYVAKTELVHELLAEYGSYDEILKAKGQDWSEVANDLYSDGSAKCMLGGLLPGLQCCYIMGVINSEGEVITYDYKYYTTPTIEIDFAEGVYTFTDDTTGSVLDFRFVATSPNTIAVIPGDYTNFIVDYDGTCLSFVEDVNTLYAYTDESQMYAYGYFTDYANDVYALEIVLDDNKAPSKLSSKLSIDIYEVVSSSWQYHSTLYTFTEATVITPSVSTSSVLRKSALPMITPVLHIE